MRSTTRGGTSALVMVLVCACGGDDTAGGGGAGAGGPGGGGTAATTPTTTGTTTGSTTASAGDGGGGAGGGGDQGGGGRGGSGQGGDGQGGEAGESPVEMPDTWDCPPEFFGTDDGCDCSCSGYDPDCDDPTQTILNCGDPHLPGEGLACEADGTCEVPATWTCDPEAFGEDDTCDCACGAVDVDCRPWNEPLPVIGCDPGEGCDAGGACAPAAVNGTCETAIPLAPGTTDGTWLDAGADSSPGEAATSCTGQGGHGYDVVYTVALVAGETLTVTVTSAQGNPSLYLVTDCAAPASTCVVGFEQAGAGEPETLVFTAPADGAWFLVVDQFLGAEVPFTMTADVTP